MKRALLVRTGAVGDYVLSLRVVAALRDSGARGITVLGRRQTSGLGAMAGVDRFFDIDTGGFHQLFTLLSPLPDGVANALAHHDIVVNMLGVSDGGILSRRLAEVSGGRVIDLHPQPDPGWSTHITEQWMADLNDAGLRTDAGPPRLIVPPSARLKARDRLAELGGEHAVLLQPGSGGRGKCWPVESFADLASDLRSSTVKPAFMVGPVEVETWSTSDRRLLERAAPVLVESDLARVAAQLSVATAYVGNDSGISHLAAACGIPVVAVFGPTDPRIWGPLGERVRVLGGGGEWPSREAVLSAAKEAVGMGRDAGR